VLQIRDVYPGSEFSKRFRILDPDPLQRIEVFLTQKIVSKLSKISAGMFIPDSDLDFLPIPDLGVKKAPDLGSQIRIRNTAKKK
jgi:hypothetical protein